MGANFIWLNFWSIFLYPQLSCKIKCPLKSRGSPHFMGNTLNETGTIGRTLVSYEHNTKLYYFSAQHSTSESQLSHLCNRGLGPLDPKIGFSPIIYFHNPVLQSKRQQCKVQRAFMSHCETYLYSFHIAQCCETQQVFTKWWISMCVSQWNHEIRRERIRENDCLKEGKKIEQMKHLFNMLAHFFLYSPANFLLSTVCS